MNKNETIELTITHADVKKSKSFIDGDNCGIAEALKRLGHKHISVGGLTVSIFPSQEAKFTHNGDSDVYDISPIFNNEDYNRLKEDPEATFDLKLIPYAHHS